MLNCSAWPSRGQVLVELALTLPLILLLIFGGIEAAFLMIAKADQDHRTIVIVEWAASHPGESWNSIAEYELEGCEVELTTPRPDLIEASATCLYQPRILRIWEGLPMTSRAQAVQGFHDTSPGASPSSSSTTRPERRLA